MKLTIVEAPASVALPLDSEALLDGVDRPDEELHATPSRPVTSSLRLTVKHLKEKFGVFGLLHGLRAYIVYNIAFTIVVGLLHVVLSPVFFQPVPYIIAIPIGALITAKLSMALTHAQITMNGTYENGQNINIFRRTGKILWNQVVTTFPSLFIIYLATDLVMVLPTFWRGHTAVLVALPFLYILSYGLQFWFKIVLVRQQASAVPSEQETIVAIDRNFGLDVDGDRVLTFQEASVNIKKDLWRILKMGIKVYAILFGYSGLLFGALFGLGLSKILKK